MRAASHPSSAFWKSMLIVAWVVQAFSSLSCGSEPAAAPAIAQPSPPPTRSPTSTPEPPTATAEPTPGLPVLAGLDTLDSYCFDVLWRLEQPGSQPAEMGYVLERVRGEQPTTHLVAFYPDPDQPGATRYDESISIGDTSWTKQQDGSWLQWEGTAGTGSAEGYWPTSDFEGWRPAGDEMVNGVRCLRYALPDGTTLSVPAGERSVRVAVQGMLCVADQHELPTVIVRQELQWQGAYSPFPFIAAVSPTGTITTVLRIDLSNINQPITVEAPEQALTANQAIETQVAAFETAMALTPTAEAIPDLMIVSAQILPKGVPGSCITELTSLVTQVCISNQGGAPAPRFSVQAESLTWTVGGLDQGGVLCLQQDGSASGQATVDSYGEVRESDEANNAASLMAPVLQEACTPVPASSQAQPHNDPPWDGAWMNIVPENHVGQTFIPTTPELFSVQVGIVTGNPGSGDDTLTLRLFSADDVVLAVMSQSVPEGFEGWLSFQLPGGVLRVAPGQPLKMELADTGKVALGWKYSGDTYPDGTAIQFGSPKPSRDFFFRVNQ